MFKTKLKNLSIITITVILTLCFSVSLQSLLAAWTAPTAEAPGNNTETPLNVGNIGQSKNAGLVVNAGGINQVGLVVASGTMAIGTTSEPKSNLDIDGFMKLRKYSSAPAVCDVSHDGSISMTAISSICICKAGTGWVSVSDDAICDWGNSTHGSITFFYTGTGQSFTVPSGVGKINVKIWGAGGGGFYPSGAGGAGAYATANLTVNSGQILSIIVGGGGGGETGVGGFGGGGTSLGSPSRNISGGGGMSSVMSSGSYLAVAGGGGGAGYGVDVPGGNGGAPDGGAGANAGGGSTGGGGGTQIAGGSAGTPGDSIGQGLAGIGGTGYYNGSTDAGAGGGGGYYGGGGGGTGTGNSGSAGGGGSSYVPVGGSMIAGNGTIAPNIGDSLYRAGVAVGGVNSKGGDGLVYISW